MRSSLRSARLGSVRQCGRQLQSFVSPECVRRERRGPCRCYRCWWRWRLDEDASSVSRERTRRRRVRRVVTPCVNKGARLRRYSCRRPRKKRRRRESGFSHSSPILSSSPMRSSRNYGFGEGGCEGSTLQQEVRVSPCNWLVGGGPDNRDCDSPLAPLDLFPTLSYEVKSLHVVGMFENMVEAPVIIALALERRICDSHRETFFLFAMLSVRTGISIGVPNAHAYRNAHRCRKET